MAKLDISNQYSLFADEASEVLAAAPGPRSRQAGAGRFHDPDPRAIRLNEVRLDEHLKQMGQRQALPVREILETLDWGGFERAYKAGGRRPYAPRAMLGVILYGILQG